MYLEGLVKIIKLKLMWFFEILELVFLIFVDLDYFIVKKKFEEMDDFVFVFNFVICIEILVVGDFNMCNL